MLRTLMASTALVMVLAGAATATNHEKTTMTRENADGMVIMSFRGVTIGQKDVEGHLASNLIGASIYNGTGENAEIVGDINDILVTDNGNVEAVIVGVGGFLGLGEKDVAIDFNRITVEDRGGNNFRLIADVRKDELEQTAEFEMDQDNMPADKTMTTGSVNRDPANSSDLSERGFAENDPRWTDADRQFMGKAKRVDATQISAEQLIGLSVYGANRNDLGEVGDIVLDESGKVDVVIIDVGGFLGLGEKPVAVSFSSLQIFREGNDQLTVMTPFTEAELDNATAYDKEKFSRDRDAVVLYSR